LVACLGQPPESQPCEAEIALEVGEGELAYPVYGHEHEELVLFDSDFGGVDTEIADRIGLELFSWFVPFEVWQLADVMAPEEPMKARAGQMGDCRLERVETIVQWQQRVFTEGNADRLVLGA